MSAMPVMLAVLGVLALAFRFYSKFLAAKVAALDDSRITPAHSLNDHQNYHPTNKWVLFGHHFAAISGAGPLIGPVLAIQFGYMPGLIWIVAGVCLAGAVQDMLVLAASVRHNGRSLAEIAAEQIGRFAGGVVGLTILFVVVIALSGLGIVVVKALGGEEAKFPKGTVVHLPPGATADVVEQDETSIVRRLPAGCEVVFPNGTRKTYSEGFPIRTLAAGDSAVWRSPVTLPAGAVRPVAGSSWGTFTIACTVPIALFVGLWMYVLRKGHVVEASVIGGVATIGATVLGGLIPGSPLEPYFALDKNGVTLAIAIYGFIASVLPVWLLLCPRDYLSSFLKIGTIGFLVVGVVIANPELKAPAFNEVFAGGGPTFPQGGVFPFVFICIMCGAVSGFHSLVSSGTTPKMIDKESHVRVIGYASMLIEGLVGVTALIAAAALPVNDYYEINIDLDRQAVWADQVAKISTAHQSVAETGQDRLSVIEREVGEDLRGRTGGAVTLAVGIAEIFAAVPGLGSLMKYWYHFAIMFEALFILTTIDTGTRIARFILQENLGKIIPRFRRTDWLPGAVLSTGLVTFAWAFLIYNGSISTIWPMFGIANQLLAVVALATITTWLVNTGRRHVAWVTLMPMMFVISTTMTAGVMLIFGDRPGNFAKMIREGAAFQGWLNTAFTVLLMGSVLTVLGCALRRLLIGPPTGSATAPGAEPAGSPASDSIK